MTTSNTAQDSDAGLSSRQRAIAVIAAFTATGRVPQLRQALAEGLDAGLTISEINEVLVQMYAYAGFPRSLNGIGTLMALIDERRANGIDDPAGRPPTPLPAGTDIQQLGTSNQTQLAGAPVTGALFTFAPAIDQFLKTHLFGDIFARDNLDWRSREVATVAALASLDGVESQLRSHIGIAVNTGLTPTHLHALVTVLTDRVGRTEAGRAREAIDTVLATRS